MGEEDKGPGKGTGAFAGRGHEAGQEGRLSAIEQFLATKFPGEFEAAESDESEEPTA